MAKAKNATNSMISLDPRFESMLEIERKQLKNKYKTAIPGKELALNRLIEQAARCKVLLDLGIEDLSKKGDVEEFRQSPNMKPYERLRPAAQLYVSREKNYLAILKALDGITPQAAPKTEVDPLEQFLR